VTVELSLRGVEKRYGRTQVLSDVSFTCPPGNITAFCGPNGAGKSTALRILTGITRADHGGALVNERSLLSVREPARLVGVLLDASAFHPGRTVRETLRLSAFTIGEPKQRADACAELVGLNSVAHRRVGQLSLGMRQRLGIAHALLGRPKALVLDEPSNGLDPNGIVWLDRLLRRFADDGGTVLISTHHIAAVERTADRLVAISRGRIVADTSIADVRGTRTTVASNDERLRTVLVRAGHRVVPAQGRYRVDLSAPEVGRLAMEHGIPLTELRPDDNCLDEFLAEVTDHEFAGVSPR